MPDYIERDRLINTLTEFIADYKDGHTFSTDFAATIVTDILNNAVKCQPAADVAPVRHGRWVWKHRHRGGFRTYTGVDSMGETHTIVVDRRYEVDDPYCSECGKLNESVFLSYCPNCGAIMTGGCDE